MPEVLRARGVAWLAGVTVLALCLQADSRAASAASGPFRHSRPGTLVASAEGVENRVEEQTVHFKAVFDGYEHGGVSRTVLGILEDAYREMGQQLDHFPLKPVTVVLYTEKDFFDITRLPAWTAGAYDGRIRLPVRGIEKESGLSLRQVLYHEYVHALVHSITPRAPMWLNEGLAEYLVPRGFHKVGQAIPIQSLENSFPLGDQRLMALAYAESFSAVSYLVEQHGLYAVKRLLMALSRGDALDAAFRGAFPISYDEFASTWGR